MSIAMAGHHGPPTPPMREPYSLRQGSLRAHPVSNLHYQQDYFDDSAYIPSGTNSAYNSPRHRQTPMDDIGSPYAHLGQSEQGFQQYDTYGNPVHAFQDDMYSHSMQHHNYPNPALHGRLLTNDMGEASGRISNQGRRIASNSYSRSPSPPKRRKTKKDNSKKSKLERPLSELTKHLENIPIKDTETWVNRSTEERRKEVGSDGFIKRPSNSFILYRSAYADRCREYEKSNNHQDISSMAGASWAIEAPEVRKQYENWAKTERENHQAAFPDYKFQPQTQEAKARKRKGKMDDESLEESDLEDPTYHGGRGATPGSARSIRSKKQRRDFRESSYTPSLGSDGEWATPEPYPVTMHNQSYYGRANPGKPMPTALSGIGPSGAYYHATSHPNVRFSNLGHVEDVMYQQQEPSGSLYETAPPVGLPGASHEDLMGEIQDNGQLMFSSSSLDPDLLAYDHAGSGPTESHEFTGGFQANEYLTEDQIDFGQDTGTVGDEWNHFDD